MDNIQLDLDENGKGAFRAMEHGAQLGEMVIQVAGRNLTVYHTGVAPQAEGKGLAKALLAAMVDHARRHQLKVIPLCPFVHAQFQRHPEAYADLWKKAER